MNRKLSDIFKSQKFQKYAAIGVFVFILLALPVILFEVQQEQTSNQHASTHVWNGGVDTCGDVHVAFESESPSCSGNTVTDSYTTTVRLTSNNGGTYNVQYLFESFWCKDTSELGDGVNPTSCIKRVKSANKTITVKPGAGVTVTSDPQVASSYGFGSSCGIYQTDFSFTIGSCRFGYSALDTNPNHPVLAAGYCNTGRVCSIPTPTTPITPTNTPAVTPTDTPIPSETPTPGVTVTPTDTPTPGLTITPTDTPNPSATPTPTPNPSDTPTPTVPNQPTSTPTPTIVIAIISPKPTLPSTGPGNVIVSTGLIGAAIVVIGLAFAIGL